MFEEFYSHPFIKSIADKERWTVVDKNKRPIDIKELMYNSRIIGCQCQDERSLTTLNTLLNVLPNAANNTFYMDSLIDRFVVLDIEPICPQNIKNELLQLPYIYGEVSMSGKGYHLVFPLPDIIYNYPAACKKIVFKEKHKYYEILLQHHITFTRNMIPPATGSGDFTALFEKLAAEQIDNSFNKLEFDENMPDEVPMQDEILDILARQTYSKTADNFYNDMSKYEYGHLSFLYEKLCCILNISKIKDNHKYTDSEKLLLLYHSAENVIPYRAKHDEFRNGMPWLMYLASQVMLKNVKTTKDE